MALTIIHFSAAKMMLLHYQAICPSKRGRISKTELHNERFYASKRSSFCPTTLVPPQARRPVGTEEQPNESDNVQDQPSPGKVRSPSPRGTWRLVFSPSLEWEEFLHEVQDVMDIPGVRGE